MAPENMLYATYKGSFDLDGRFTGSSIIHMRKADRRNLQIEGEEVFEADIKNCLPSLMYAQEIGEPCHGDAYEIHGVPRELAKTALVIMLNCYDRKTALQAVQGAINRDTGLYAGGHRATDIVARLEDKHAVVADCLYTGTGRKLMNLESRCMCAFIDQMLAMQMKTYPIYDSVIGRVSDRATINRVFTEAFTVNGVSPKVHFS